MDTVLVNCTILESWCSCFHRLLLKLTNIMWDCELTWQMTMPRTMPQIWSGMEGISGIFRKGMRNLIALGKEFLNHCVRMPDSLLFTLIWLHTFQNVEKIESFRRGLDVFRSEVCFYSVPLERVEAHSNIFLFFTVVEIWISHEEQTVIVAAKVFIKTKFRACMEYLICSWDCACSWLKNPYSGLK